MVFWKVRTGEVRMGQVRTDQVGTGQVGALVSSGQVNLGQVKLGQVKSEQVNPGQVKSGQGKSGQVKSSQDWTNPLKTGQVNMKHVKSIWDTSSQFGTGFGRKHLLVHLCFTGTFQVCQEFTFLKYKRRQRKLETSHLFLLKLRHDQLKLKNHVTLKYLPPY